MPSLETDQHIRTTTYTFSFPEHKIERIIEVPFSEEEIALLKQARELVMLLKNEMSRGSGWQREAYLKGIPWGGKLVNRITAISDIQSMRDYMDSISHYPDYSEDDIAQRPKDFAVAMNSILDQLL